MSSQIKRLYEFGPFRLDPQKRQLLRGSESVALTPKAIETLLVLVENRDRVVSKDDLMKTLWPDCFVEESNLSQNIFMLRKALGDSAQEKRYILTAPGRGYQFVAAVEEIGSGAAAIGTVAQNPDSLIGKKISHYRVLQVLGGGGMGVVYRAEDLKLGRRVAMKFLPTELASDPIALERMQREARAASSLDHPNICSIYELGEHECQPFIVMQLLEGRTLREWIESASPLDSRSRIGELLKLAGQIADGLEAAHKKGIIHRDMKPANIFVTTGGQAKILDFGVAQIAGGLEPSDGRREASGASSEAAEPSLTRTGDSVGTPSYLSPEQIRHEKLDARSDLFSFGLVLYEMATGQRAFAGNTATTIREAVLRLPARSPRHVDPTIPNELERIIQKSLEKNPNQRYQSAADLQSDLRTVAPAIRPEGRRRRLRFMLTAAAMLVAVFLAALAVSGLRKRLFSSSDKGEPVAQVKTRPSVAVVGFKNLSGKGDEAWISTALAEMLSTDLAAGQQVRVISGENIARMKLDLSLSASDGYARDTLDKIRRHLNSDMVVLGSYLAMGKDSGGRIRLDVQLQDARVGETIASMSTDGTETDLADLVSRSGATLRQRLGIGDISAQDKHRVSSSVPNNPQAARLYVEGLTRFQAYDALGARDLLQKAIAMDPNHAPSRLALAQCWTLLGYDAPAREEAKKALDLSGNLLREDQLSIEAHYRETNHEWQKAVEIYRMLWGVFPDNLEYGLRLAKAQASAGSGKDAIATIEALQKLPPPAGADPRIDLAETFAADNLGDVHREEAAAARAAAKGRQQGAKVITASALLNRGAALMTLGNNKDAIPALQEARDFFFAVGDQQSASRAIIDLAIIARHQSNLDEAQKLLESALEISRRVGNARGIMQAESNLGAIFFDKRDLPRSMEAFQEALKHSREIGAKRSESIALGDLGNLLTAQGRLRESFQAQEQTLKLSRELGDEEGEAIDLGNIADILTREGDLRAAKKADENAITIHQKVGDKSYQAYALHQLGEILLEQGDVAGGRARYQQAAALRHELGEKVTEAESQMQLAGIQLDTGDAPGAEKAARDTAAVFHSEGAFDDEALSYSLLSRALVGEKDAPGALQAIAKSKELLMKSIDQATNIRVAIDDAYVAGMLHSPTTSDGKRPSAALALEAVREKADHMGYGGLSLEARLCLGEVELENGLAKAGRAHLDLLLKDAQAKGFVLIARKASAAMKLESARR